MYHIINGQFDLSSDLDLSSDRWPATNHEMPATMMHMIHRMVTQKKQLIRNLGNAKDWEIKPQAEINAAFTQAVLLTNHNHLISMS